MVTLDMSMNSRKRHYDDTIWCM